MIARVKHRLAGDVVETCRFCGRGLVSSHPDGTFDLAGKASVSAFFPLVPEQTVAGVPQPETAVCLLWRCRLRRWLERRRLERLA